MKVYCGRCKYFHFRDGECKNIHNIEEDKTSDMNWFLPEVKYRERPSILNKNNDCKWFEESSTFCNPYRLQMKDLNKCPSKS